MKQPARLSANAAKKLSNMTIPVLGGGVAEDTAGSTLVRRKLVIAPRPLWALAFRIREKSFGYERVDGIWTVLLRVSDV